ncbi:hypothetical protein PVAP13_5NG648601 [Panicum virgatum]|uniref:Uncharacterized protein n=1 Tax=Panicum virgatum TaxID=38727 RepID=A0A8T0S8T6_PANVG|nr:hypothetical protein PVAP13_5NG648601 [Panicum virgatum]
MVIPPFCALLTILNIVTKYSALLPCLIIFTYHVACLVFVVLFNLLLNKYEDVAYGNVPTRPIADYYCLPMPDKRRSHLSDLERPEAQHHQG